MKILLKVKYEDVGKCSKELKPKTKLLVDIKAEELLLLRKKDPVCYERINTLMSFGIQLMQ